MNSYRKIKFLHIVEYASVRALFGFLKLLPYSTRISFVHFVLKFLSLIASTIPKRIKGGIQQAFSEMKTSDVEKIFRENLKITARMVVDFEEGPRMNDDFLKDKFLYEPSEEEFRKICRGGGILILGHLGNWETHGVGITRALRETGVELYVFSKRQSNRLTNDWIEKTRAKQNIKLIYTDESPRVALSLLKKGHLVAFIADQDAGKHGLFIPFLGKPASTFLGPAVFARSIDSPVHFMWSRYTPEGKLVLGTLPLERPAIDPKKDSDLWEKAFTYNWVKILEKKVLEHPASYFWLHRRWKRQPENPEEVLLFWKEFSAKNWFSGNKN